jgi:N-acetylglutamate synthase-like GNAT family acetyltransferase
MRIRQASVHDLPQVLRFLSAGIARTDWHTDVKAYVRRYIINKNNFVLIAIENNSVLGMAAGELWADKKFAYLGQLEAKPQKKEVITSLVDALKILCRKKGITLIITYVNIKNPKAIANYRLVGMKKIGDYLGLTMQVLNK